LFLCRRNFCFQGDNLGFHSHDWRLGCRLYLQALIKSLEEICETRHKIVYSYFVLYPTFPNETKPLICKNKQINNNA
jgi:hypothetical protein